LFRNIPRTAIYVVCCQKHRNHCTRQDIIIQQRQHFLVPNFLNPPLISLNDTKCVQTEPASDQRQAITVVVTAPDTINLLPQTKTSFDIQENIRNQPTSIGIEHFQGRYNGTVNSIVLLPSYDYKQNTVYWTQVTLHSTFLYHIGK